MSLIFSRIHILSCEDNFIFWTWIVVEIFWRKNVKTSEHPKWITVSSLPDEKIED
jgi:hypothetical protein